MHPIAGTGKLGAMARFTAPGLDEADVQDRVARGQVNHVALPPSRTVKEIVRANVMTRFNAILGGLLVVIIVVGPVQDGLFGFVLVANTAIGILQELRAKRTLDHLALLTAPAARVVRGGEVREIDLEEVVLDDVLELQPGDQIVVDGELLEADGLEVDESLLSGEAEPAVKNPGDGVLSGSFVVAGNGRYRATRVGRAAYAGSLAAEARRFSLVRSELQAGINWILRLVTWAIVPVAVLLVSTQLATHASVPEALRSSVAGVGSMVPEGLVLLTSIAFAVGVVRLGKRHVLVQELPALEGLARVDVVCIDKTGTLTEGEITVVGVVELVEGEHGRALAALAAADPNPNATLGAVGTAFGAVPDWEVRESVPFSSARKWGGASFRERGTWVLGAPEVLLDGDRARANADARPRAEKLARAGRRVVLLARADRLPTDGRPPGRLRAMALVVLEERVRPDAASTVAYFAAQGVAVKVISGDHPSTVGAIAGRVGIPNAQDPIDARKLSDDRDALADAMESGSVFGRVLPRQKQAMVGALQSRGHVVAMTGDGVNDVLALKDADVGVAMGSGSPAARAVARLVLMDNAFASLPGVVGEGRRVIANVERVANLFVTKTVYALLLAVAVGVARLPFPFLPRHLTIVSSLTIGIPAFFLALAPNARRARPGFVSRVVKFAAPAGVVAAAVTFSAYALARVQPDVSLDEARTAATLALFGVGLWVFVILARPVAETRKPLAWGMGITFLVVLALPWSRDYFALNLPPALVVLATLALVAIGGLVLEGSEKAADWIWARMKGEDPPD